MKELKLDVKGIISNQIENINIDTSIVAIRGNNYSDVALLTMGKDKRYFWSRINSSYAIEEFMSNDFTFKDTDDAIFRVMLLGKTVYYFANIYEFSEWMYQSKETAPKSIKNKN